MKISLIIILSIFLSIKNYSQITNDFKLLPNINFGYTFGKGVNCTLGCGISFVDYESRSINGYSGLEVSYSIFTHKKELYTNGFYRAISINVFNVLNEQLITKLGIAKTKLKWGFNSVNTSHSKGWGTNFEIDIKPLTNSPYLGFRYFKTNNVCLGMGNSNPKFLYLGYQRPIVLPIGGPLLIN